MNVAAIPFIHLTIISHNFDWNVYRPLLVHISNDLIQIHENKIRTFDEQWLVTILIIFYQYYENQFDFISLSHFRFFFKKKDCHASIIWSCIYVQLVQCTRVSFYELIKCNLKSMCWKKNTEKHQQSNKPNTISVCFGICLNSDRSIYCDELYRRM